MSTFKANKVAKEPFAESVEFSTSFMHVRLCNGLHINVPLTAYRLLHEATPEQWASVEISPYGIALHWEELDEDLSVSGLLRDFGAQQVIYTS